MREETVIFVVEIIVQLLTYISISILKRGPIVVPFGSLQDTYLFFICDIIISGGVFVSGVAF